MRALAAAIVLATPILNISASAQSIDLYELTRIPVPGRIEQVAVAADGVFARTSDEQVHLIYEFQGAVTFNTVITSGLRTDLPADMLPQSREVWRSGHIQTVRLIQPTGRYRHGVLGDRLEAATLEVRTRRGAIAELELGDDAVFEDLLPRLADVDDDGLDEIIIVKSYLDRGAALAVVGLGDDGNLAILAETPPIGRPNRWLNPIGAADFDGDGAVEIAYVETPHIGGRLMIWEWRGGRLVREHDEPGFSNHAIGSTELGLSAIADIDGDGLMDLAVPGSRRDRLRLISLADGVLRQIADIDIGGVVATAIVPVGPALVFGLDDGRLIALRFGP